MEIILNKLWDQTKLARDINDYQYFMRLLDAGEFLIKISTVAYISCIDDDSDMHRHNHLFALARADSLGPWVETLNTTINTVPTDLLSSGLRSIRTELTKSSADSWQNAVASQLRDCLNIATTVSQQRQGKASLLDFFSDFVTLRNKTKGHGIVRTRIASKVCGKLSDALWTYQKLFQLFEFSWVYIHKNYSGKINPRYWGPNKLPINEKHIDKAGIYLNLGDKFKRVELLDSDIDIDDISIANGHYNKKRHQVDFLSYITGHERRGDLSKSLMHSGVKSPSETASAAGLQITENCLHNLPPKARYYVDRSELEIELNSLLSNDYTRIVTLRGLGGIGKTTLALSTLHDLMSSDRFLYVLWFSSRDVDLFDTGPISVKPDVLTIGEIAEQYHQLIELEPNNHKRKGLIRKFAAALQFYNGDPTLFVFDNFETLSDLDEIYDFIWNNVRPPNKVLITTRHRLSFNEDRCIDVGGMSARQSKNLIANYSKKLGLQNMPTKDEIDRIVVDSSGHPYVIQLMLSEFARTDVLPKGLVRNETVLVALFDRTFDQLSFGAKRVFLTLSRWSPCFAELAIKLVLNHNDVRFGVVEAIEELVQTSLIEIRTVQADQRFLLIPAPARLFGRGKLKVSPIKPDVDRDLDLLKWFGVINESQVARGVEPVISKFIMNLADAAEVDVQLIDHYGQLLENLGTLYPACCLEIATLFKDHQHVHIGKERKFVNMYLTSGLELDLTQTKRAWEWLAAIQRRSGNLVNELSIRVSMIEQVSVSYRDISNAAHLHGYIVGNKVFSPSEKPKMESLAIKLIFVMERGIHEAGATDCSRLAWLFYFLQDFDSAHKWCVHGLALDEDNFHCLGLYERLDNQVYQ
ncbi:MAG: NB-ARC domain-containing protein [Caldilineaceae bacterium]|nr:NB-ARC domain-containing protein [Caldilineaceae bacterium]